MTSLYKQSVPVLIKYLKGLSHLLQKGAKFCEEKGVKPEQILPYQVQSCSNTAKFAVSRLGAANIPTFEDNETTFDELQTRIDRTIKLLEGVDESVLDGKESQEIIMESKMGNFRFTGQRYISEYIIPNFHFHLTSAYCILRTQGVPIGAFDYLKDVFEKV